MARANKIPLDENGVPFEQPFPGYEVFQKLHEGHHGVLWCAREQLFDRDVVIRQMYPDMTLREEVVQTFFGEARSVARLKHPHLVRGVDCGRAGESFFFVSEYVGGDSLQAILEQNPRLEEMRALEIVRQMAEALAYLDEQGMFHGAIKPSNIIVDREGVVRLCDLGVAKDVLYASPVKRFRLYPEYCAPEAFHEDDYLDMSSDIYALGIVLWRMLAGQVPFRGMQEVVIRGHQEKELPSIREENPLLSAGTASLLGQMLKKDRSERMGTAEELQEALRELLPAPVTPEI